MSAATPQLVTAAQVAKALGVSPRAIRLRLGRVPADGTLVCGGNAAAAWRPTSLPIAIQAQLEAVRKEGGFWDTGALCAAAAPVALPPIAGCHPDEVQEAVKLRSALERALTHRNSSLLNGGDLVAMGLSDYRQAFGRQISERHWRRLFQRTIKRAGATANFSRLELYLPDNPRSKPVAATAAAFDEDAGLAAIRERVHAFADPLAPSRAERALIWTLAVEWFRERVATGESTRGTKQRLFDFLTGLVPALAGSRDSLRKTFDAWLRDPNRRDRRALANAQRARTYQEDEIDRLVFEACEKFRNRVAPAVRTLVGEETGREASSVRFEARSKSYVPASLLAEVSRRVEAVAPFFQGPRAADAATPPLDLSYDWIASMDGVVLDDFTLNSYVYLELPGGKFKLSRCQVILAIDFRSLRILGWSLSPEEQPNSLAARTVCSRVFRDYGIPKVLYLERGRVFKESLLMTGGAKAGRPNLPGWEMVPSVEVEVGLRQFGLEIIHARRARSKPIERVGDLVQSLMDGERGWAGRNERTERPEALTRQMYEVETGKTHPSKYFYSFEQWDARLDEIFTRYNAIVQEGKRLAGESPDQMFARLWPHENPPRKFDENCEFLLAHHRSAKVIKGGAVSFRVRGESYCYRDERLTPDEGREVLTHWNPEMPEYIAVTDRHLRNPITIARCGKPNALTRLFGPSDPVLDEETAKVNRHMRHWRTYYRTLKTKFMISFRLNDVAPRVEKLGAAIQEQQKRVEREQRVARTETRQRQRIATRTGRRLEELPADATAYDDLLKSGIRELEQQSEGDQG